MPISLQLLLSLIGILLAAEIFTNALEHLGQKLKISEGMTGSIFAAVATALPETMVPLLAIFSAGTANQAVHDEIGVGAILGAPMMLSTLTLFLMAIAALSHRGFLGHLMPEKSGLTRDLNFFLFAFILSCAALFVPHTGVIRAMLGFVLVATYFLYVLLTVRASAALVADGHATEAEESMYLTRFLRIPTNSFTILLQLGMGLSFMVFAAHEFITGVEAGSKVWAISALLLSLIVIPIATELPEKINSILWIRKHKDTLAFGNITGAMVFQGTLLPAIGITLTPWEPRMEVFTGVVITIIGALWLRILIQKSQIRVWHLFVNGLLYMIYLWLVLG